MFTTNNPALTKLACENIVSSAIFLSMEQTVTILIYLKGRNYQPGDTLTWAELKDECPVDVLTPDVMANLGFTWLSLSDGVKTYKGRKDDLKNLEGNLTFTKTSEDLDQLYKIAEMYEIEFKKDPNLWNQIFRTMLVKYSVKGYSLLDQEIQEDVHQEAVNSLIQHYEKKKVAE